MISTNKQRWQYVEEKHQGRDDWKTYETTVQVAVRLALEK